MCPVTPGLSRTQREVPIAAGVLPDPGGDGYAGFAREMDVGKPPKAPVALKA